MTQGQHNRIMYGAVGLLYVLFIASGVYGYSKYQEVKTLIDLAGAASGKVDSVKEKIQHLKEKLR
jgi:hypothetical protein